MHPEGYQAQVIEEVTLHYSPAPVVVDIGVGRPVWYGGGTTFSTYPYTPNPIGAQFHLSLPAIGIAGFPAVTVVPRAGVPCDVDRDGDMDIVRLNEWNGWAGLETFQVFLNQGSGNFTAGYRFDIDRSGWHAQHDHLYHVACADFDGDGDPDAAVLMGPDDVNRTTNPWRQEGSLTIRWNDGLGQFPTSTVLHSSGYRRDSGMSVADVDRDGDADILCDGYTVDAGGGTFENLAILYRNSGTGSFTIVNEGGQRPARLADLNRDGWLDAGWGTLTGLNNGQGAIGDMGINNSFVGSARRDYLYADADGDGILDCVTNNQGNLVFLKGDGDGDFALSGTVMVSLPSPAAAIGAGDGDADGDTDFFLHLNNGTYALVENRSPHQKAGAFTQGAYAWNVQGVTQIEAGDLNRDGLSDIVAVCPSQTRLWMLPGDAVSGVGAPQLIRNTSPAVPHSAVVADFDRNGREDVAYSIPAAGEVRMGVNSSTSPGAWTHVTLASGLPGVSLLAKGEFGTPSGRPDILTSSDTTGALRWLYRTGSSWATQGVLSSSSPVPHCIFAANGSNRPGDEVFSMGQAGEGLFLRGYQLNPSWMELGTALTAPAPAVPSVMTPLDVTGDGRIEAIYVQNDGTVAYWNFSAGSGGLVGAPDAAVRAMTTLDWDRDGRADILCATASGLGLFTRKPAWQYEPLIARAGGYTAVIPYNLNRDAWMDVAVADSATSLVTAIKNEPLLLDVVQTTPAAVSIVTGLTTTTLSASATSRGVPADPSAGNQADLNSVVTEASLFFYRAVASGNTWVKGSALTSAELSQAVASVFLVADNTIIANKSAGSIVGSGQLNLDHNGTVVPFAPGATRTLGIRLATTAGAAQSAFSRFFMEWGYLEGYPQDNLSASRVIRLANSQPVLVTITPALTALQQWRVNNFGNWQSTGSAANDADPDADGVPNLVEYVMSRDPNSGSGSLGGNAAPLDITYTNRETPVVVNLRTLTNYDSKVRLTIQYSTNLQSWTTLTTRTGTGAWSVAPDSTTLLSGGGRSWFKFSAASTPQTNPKLHFRLKAEELP